MGAHSNYISVESDDITAMVIVVIMLLIFVVLFIWNRIEDKKAEKAAWEEWHKQKEEEANLNAEMHFFENRIAEDMLHIGSKINTKLVELYREECNK